MAKSDLQKALDELTGLQKAFVLEYSRCNFNGTEAAARAGYKGDRNQLASIASENLRKPKIRAAIDLLLKERALSADEVLKLLADHARSAHSEYFMMKSVTNSDGEVIGRYPAFDFERCKADGNEHLIKEIRYTQSGIDFRFHDAQAALFKLGQQHGLFTADGIVNVSVQVNVTADDLAQARSKAQQFEDDLLDDSDSDQTE